MSPMRALLLSAAVLVSAGSNNAGAADLYGGSIKDGGYAPVVESARRSFYLRLDGGYSWAGQPDISETQVCGSCSTTYDLTETSLDDTWTLGGGVGMNITNRIRADLTYDHLFSADAEGWLGEGALIGMRKFDVSSDVFLANLYYDFDFGSRITPYVGAGIGFARNKTGAGTVEDCGCVVGNIESGSNTELAFAGMAGVSILLTHGQQVMGGIKDAPVFVDSVRKLSLDIGYRYLYLGDAETGPVTRAGVNYSDDPVVESMDAHQIRVGLRYNLQ